MEIANKNNNPIIHVFKSNGRYLGFIKDGFFFSRDGVYMGWLEGKFVWDKNGDFKGSLAFLEGNQYILVDKFSAPPTSRTPKKADDIPNPPDPPQNIKQISLPVGIEDAF